jgi:hypothetical protein
MSLEGRMNQSAEARLGRKQLDNRADVQTIEELSVGYSRFAEQALSGADAISVRDEISRFVTKISSTEGPAQYEHLNKLVSALYLRKRSVFEVIPEDEHERAAFALALVNGYKKSLQ